MEPRVVVHAGMPLAAKGVDVIRVGDAAETVDRAFDGSLVVVLAILHPDIGHGRGIDQRCRNFHGPVGRGIADPEGFLVPDLVAARGDSQGNLADSGIEAQGDVTQVTLRRLEQCVLVQSRQLGQARTGYRLSRRARLGGRRWRLAAFERPAARLRSPCAGCAGGQRQQQEWQQPEPSNCVRARICPHLCLRPLRHRGQFTTNYVLDLMAGRAYDRYR